MPFSIRKTLMRIVSAVFALLLLAIPGVVVYLFTQGYLLYEVTEERIPLGQAAEGSEKKPAAPAAPPKGIASLVLHLPSKKVVIWVPRGEEAEESEAGGLESAISVKTIRPHHDGNFPITVERPCDVEAYYWADIEARVAGMVKWIKVADGSSVKEDQELLQIDVPDLVATAKEKQFTIEQRRKEEELAHAKWEAAVEAEKTAAANVKEKTALKEQATAEVAYRLEDYRRVAALRARNSIDANVVDVAAKNLDFARATKAAMEAAIVKAEAEQEDAKAGIRVAKADEEQKAKLIDVATANYEEAKAKVDFALVKAPFKGSIVHRNVDPGSFVQNASTGHPTPLVSLARTDIVTVVMRVPDNFAPYVHPGTEAVLTFDALPGLQMHGQVTRFSPSLTTATRDRTMRVEVDLWNADPAKYKAFFDNPHNLEELKPGQLGPDGKPLLPVLPDWMGADARELPRQLLPDMYGKMKLILRQYDGYLVPSSAVIYPGGQPQMYVVAEGEHGKKAHLVPVDVRGDDGEVAMVLIGKQAKDDKSKLTDNLAVVTTNQEELSEGQRLETSYVDDWKKLRPQSQSGH